MFDGMYVLPDYYYNKLHNFADNLWEKDRGYLLKKYIKRFIINKQSILVTQGVVGMGFINEVNNTNFNNKQYAIDIFMDLMDELYRLDESRIVKMFEYRRPSRKKSKSKKYKSKKSKSKKSKSKKSKSK